MTTDTQSTNNLGLEMKIVLSMITLIAGLFFVAPAFAQHTCRDGWQSDSNGSGTCSHHGGEGD
jgi:hypothetical protein